MQTLILAQYTKIGNTDRCVVRVPPSGNLGVFLREVPRQIPAYCVQVTRVEPESWAHKHALAGYFVTGVGTDHNVIKSMASVNAFDVYTFIETPLSVNEAVYIQFDSFPLPAPQVYTAGSSSGVAKDQYAGSASFAATANATQHNPVPASFPKLKFGKFVPSAPAEDSMDEDEEDAASVATNPVGGPVEEDAPMSDDDDDDVVVEPLAAPVAAPVAAVPVAVPVLPAPAQTWEQAFPGEAPAVSFHFKKSQAEHLEESLTIRMGVVAFTFDAQGNLVRPAGPLPVARVYITDTAEEVGTCNLMFTCVEPFYDGVHGVFRLERNVEAFGTGSPIGTFSYRGAWYVLTFDSVSQTIANVNPTGTAELVWWPETDEHATRMREQSSVRPFYSNRILVKSCQAVLGSTAI